MKPTTTAAVVGAGALLLGYASLLHLTTTHGNQSSLGALLTIAPVGLMALALAWRLSRRLPALLLWTLVAALIAWQWPWLKAHFVWFNLLQQTGFYGLLGLTFGQSLSRDRVPLCTRMALLVHGTLAVDAQRYTRQLTLAWTLFFAAVCAALIVLFVAAPLAIWSAFANFGVLALVMLMFLIENRVRRRLLPDMDHVGVLATIRASAKRAH